MEISQRVAEELGFPKPHYRIVERERRWLCRELPHNLVESVERITDLYVSGTRLRLREARPVDGGPAMLRLSRKADADETTRLISSIYLSEDDFATLNCGLDGSRLSKTRHRLGGPPDISLCVEFDGALSGLLIAEAEFSDNATLQAFEPPIFALQEISSDERFSGFALATRGLPAVP